MIRIVKNILYTTDNTLYIIIFITNMRILDISYKICIS